MGQTHSAPPQDALRFRHMARTTYFGQLKDLRHYFHPSLVALQISRATYLDICMQEQIRIDSITDSLQREDQSNALQDEKMEFFAAVEKGKLVLGDTILHIAVRLSHEDIVDFLLLTDHIPRPLTAASVTPAPRTQRPTSGGHRSKATAGPNSTGSGLNSTQTPNFKGELPHDVAPNAVLRLVLGNVTDVHDVFGVEYKDEPKVHRLVRSLGRVWPLWMLEGQQEAANLVRVLYDTRSSDPAFGNLVKVTLAAADRFRLAVSRDGVKIAGKVLADSGGQLHIAKQTVHTTWDNNHKRQLLFAIFRNCFRTWHERRHSDRDQLFADFMDGAMDAWLSIAQDLKLHEQPQPPPPNGNGCNSNLDTSILDAATLRRYDLQVWKHRLRPPPQILDDLCMHITAIEQYLDLTNLKA